MVPYETPSGFVRFLFEIRTEKGFISFLCEIGKSKRFCMKPFQVSCDIPLFEMENLFVPKFFVFHEKFHKCPRQLFIQMRSHLNNTNACEE